MKRTKFRPQKYFPLYGTRKHRCIYTYGTFSKECFPANSSKSGHWLEEKEMQRY